MGFNVEYAYCYDMSGRFLWSMVQRLNRLWKVGDVFTRDKRMYVVRHAATTEHIMHLNIETVSVSGIIVEGEQP